MSNKDWDPNLTPEQNYVLRQEGTESPGSSSLNNEKREGSYHCVGCGTKLFDSSANTRADQAGLILQSFARCFRGKNRHAYRLSKNRISL